MWKSINVRWVKDTWPTYIILKVCSLPRWLLRCVCALSHLECTSNVLCSRRKLSRLSQSHSNLLAFVATLLVLWPVLSQASFVTKSTFRQREHCELLSIFQIPQLPQFRAWPMIGRLGPESFPPSVWVGSVTMWVSCKWKLSPRAKELDNALIPWTCPNLS